MQSQYVHFRWHRSLLLMGAALGLAVLLTWYHSGSVRENLQAVLHTHRAIHSGEQFLSALKDCETGQREYLLTGKKPTWPLLRRAKRGLVKDCWCSKT
jgi:CHASE3 domain sensor protein